MRRTSIAALFLVLVCTAAPASGRAQATEGAQMKTLPQSELDAVKVLLAQERAWNKGDLDGFLLGYRNSPETLFIGTDVARGFADMAAHYKKSYPDRASMGTLTFSDLVPRTLDERFVVLTGRFALERGKKAGGPASGIFSLVLEKTEAGWKIIVDHTS